MRTGNGASDSERRCNGHRILTKMLAAAEARKSAGLQVRHGQPRGRHPANPLALRRVSGPHQLLQAPHHIRRRRPMIFSGAARARARRLTWRTPMQDDVCEGCEAVYMPCRWACSRAHGSPPARRSCGGRACHSQRCDLESGVAGTGSTASASSPGCRSTTREPAPPNLSYSLWTLI